MQPLSEPKGKTDITQCVVGRESTKNYSKRFIDVLQKL